MKNINESLSNIRSLRDSIQSEQIDEGLRDILKIVKDKFDHAWTYLKGVVTKLGSYFLKVDENGEIIPAITPLTAGQAMKDGLIDKKATSIALDKEGRKITGHNTTLNDIIESRRDNDPISFWKSLAKEIKESQFSSDDDLINEVKLEADDKQRDSNVIVDDERLKKHIFLSIKMRDSKLLIWGAPGIGKTAILDSVIKSIQKEHPDYNFIYQTLAYQSHDSFTLPKYVKTVRGEMAGDLPKSWLPVWEPTGDPVEDKKRDDACGEGLLFIDELNRAKKDVLDVVLPIINEKRLGEWKLGSGWTIICASNRPDDEKGLQPLSKALTNRFRHVYYEPCYETWERWAKKQGFISPLLLQWLNMKTDGDGGDGGRKYFYWDPEEETEEPSATWCTPRAWTEAMKYICEYFNTASLAGFNLLDLYRRDPEGVAECINLSIPKDAKYSFFKFLDIVDGVGDFDKFVKDIWSKGNPGKIKTENMSKINIALAQLICVSHAKKLPTPEEFENVCKWLVKQDSSSIAGYFMDVFYNTFIPEGADPEWVMTWYKIKDIRKEHYKHTKIKKFCEKWGISPDDMPDYTAGVRTLAAKYGDDFAAAVIDGKEGLG